MIRAYLQVGLTFALLWMGREALDSAPPAKPSVRLRVISGIRRPVTIRFWVFADPADTLRYVTVTAYDEDGEKVEESGKDATPGQRLYTFPDWVDCPFAGEIRVMATAWWEDGTRKTDQRTILIAP